MVATFTEARRQAGYTIGKPRNQWSAHKPRAVDTRDHPRFAEWGERQGNGIRKKDIARALDPCHGRTDLILCVAEDPQARRRRIRIARTWSQRIGKPDRDAFDETTGQFRLELHPAEDMHNG